VWEGLQIKVLDENGHTVAVFGRLAPYAPPTQHEVDGKVVAIAAMEARWMAMPKPDSKQSRRHIDAQLDAHGIWTPPQYPTSAPHKVVRFDKDSNPVRVELPGLTLRWEKVTAVLDTLAENGIREITLTQLRKYA
jgi:hypothetical protein